MKRWSLFIVGLMAAAVASAQHKHNVPESKQEDWATAYVAGYTRDKWLVILDAERNFYAAKRDAERISKLSRVPFSMEGMQFDQRRGLALPDTGDGAPDAGGYIARRYNEDAANSSGYISIEKSDGYPGLREGLYVVVGAICNSSREANAKLRHFQQFARSAYVAKTQIYMGCIH
jgi:hypothetical protein